MLPSSVTRIGDEAFSYASALETVHFSEGLTELGEDAFESCSSLKEIALPESLRTIGEGAFRYCGLETVRIPDGATSFGSYCFEHCESLVTATLPVGMTEVPWGLFYNCTSLREIAIPEGVVTIGEDAFNDCAIESVDLPESLRVIEAQAFSGCPIEAVDFPDGLEEVLGYAFTELRQVYISKGLRTLEVYLYFLTLSDITVDPENPYFRLEGNCLIATESNRLLWGKYAEEIPDSVTSIASDAFFGSETLRRAIIPEGVTELFSMQFFGCYSLEYVYIHAGVTKIGHSPFDSALAMTALQKVEVSPDNPYFAVTGERSLVDLRDGRLICYYADDPFPEGVVTVTSGAVFTDGTELIFPEGVKVLEVSCVVSETLRSVTLPRTIESISYQAFAFCENLSEIHYYGTEEEWDAIVKASSHESWCEDMNVYCLTESETTGGDEKETWGGLDAVGTRDDDTAGDGETGCHGVSPMPFLLCGIPLLVLLKKREP